MGHWLEAGGPTRLLFGPIERNEPIKAIQTSSMTVFVSDMILPR